MFFNFIKVTLKNIIANRSYSLINIFGLAIGIACALLFTLYINHELRYDRFHSDYSAAFRVTLHGKMQSTSFEGATTSGKLAPVLGQHQKVKEVTRISRLGAWLISYDSVRYNEDNLLFVDSNFFNFFDGFKIVEGDAKTMLLEPRSIVLTQSSAKKYFGTEKNIIGQFLKIETKDKLYKVTGIIKDPPSFSHIQFDMLASFSTFDHFFENSWTSNNVYTYVKLKQESFSKDIIVFLDNLYQKYIRAERMEAMGNSLSPDDEYKFTLQPLTNIHLNSKLVAEIGENTSALYVFSLAGVALLILIIACFNFINLSTANSINRSYEVSIRKITGADKSQLVTQFILESVVYSLIALIIALLLTELILPLFNQLLGLSLQFGILHDLRVILIIFLFTIAIGVVAGSYPAFYITAVNPTEVLSGRQIQVNKGCKLRMIYVTFQLTSAILITIMCVFSLMQNRYMNNKKLGFKQDNMLIIRRSDALNENMEAFSKSISENKDVLAVTNSRSIPGRNFIVTTFQLNGATENSALICNMLYVGPGFFNTYNLKLNEGRFFDALQRDDTNVCVINSSAAKKMGLSYPVGASLKPTTSHKKLQRDYNVVGVVEDFHFADLTREIEPLIICPMPGNWEGFVTVSLLPEFSLSTLAAIEREWYRFVPEYPFVYFYLKDDLSSNYTGFQQFSRLLLVFSVLSIFVASLGYFGLVSNNNNHQVNQIAVHRALGASVPELAVRLGIRSLIVFFIASFIAVIAGLFLLKYWLQDIYYNIGISPVYFILAIILVLLTILPILVFNLLSVIKRNPGFSLKYQ